MKLIGKVTDIDIEEKLVEVNNSKKTAVRAILLNEKGEIAILHKSKKMNIN